jgi:hypothetical protein
MYVCIVGHDGAILVHRNMKVALEPFLKAIAPYRDNLVVAVEGIFTWYWLADRCAQESISCVRGHALYMKAVRGGKAKNDTIDSQSWQHCCAVAYRKPLSILPSCMLPETACGAAHTSPGETPEVDDAFLRRRMQTREHHGSINRKDDGPM